MDAEGSFLSGRKLFGLRVENPRGEDLGKIEDIMISPAGGQAAYAVVSFGGLLGLGKKLFAIPWSALRVDRPGNKVILNLDKATLATARGFEKGRGPDSSGWNAGDFGPSPAPPARRVDAEPVAVSPAAAPGKLPMEQWGKSWQSHGLDRS